MNFSNLDTPYNKAVYKEGHPETEVAYMGCVDAVETLTYSYKGKEKTDTFGNFVKEISLDVEAARYSEKSVYYDVAGIVKVYDSDKGDMVGCRKVIVNSEVTNWVKLKLSNGQVFTCTDDHPLPVYNSGKSVRTYVKDIIIGDRLMTADGSIVTVISIENIDGKCDNSYDVETETDRFDVSDIRSHNCRTRVATNIYDPNKAVIPGRGNLSFTSINLPRLAIEANGNIDVFFESLDRMMELVHRQLLERFELQCKKHPRNYPFLMGQGVWIDSDKLGPDDDIRAVLKHGTLTVGFIGLAETLVALIGKHHGESEEALQLGLKIIARMREYTDAWSKEEHMNYSVIGTPAEGLSGRFVRIDKEKYGSIPGVTDRDYYTNSSH